MTHHSDTSCCHYAKANACSLDNSSHDEEERARMQAIDLDYLQQRTHECIENRHAPSSLYTTYARHQASMAVPQGYFTRFVPNESSPARRSELASRIVKQRKYLSYRTKPLECGGAISLQEPSQLPPVASLQQGSVDSVFFDEERFDKSSVVFINGDPHHVSGGRRTERTLYGLDSPTASIRDALAAAAANQIGKLNGASPLAAVQKGMRGSPKQIAITSHAKRCKGKSSERNKECKRQYGKDSPSPDKYREYGSSSMRRLRVRRFHRRHLSPIEESGKEKGPFHGEGGKEPSETKMTRKCELAECNGDISVRRVPRKEREAEAHRSGGRNPVKDGKELLSAGNGHTMKPHKPSESSKTVRGKDNGSRQIDPACDQYGCATEYTCRSCGRNWYSTSPINGSSESSSLSLSRSADAFEDITDAPTNHHHCDDASSGKKRHHRSFGHHGALQNDRAKHRLPPIGGDQWHYPVPLPPLNRTSHPRDEHRCIGQHRECGSQITKQRGRRSDLLSDSSELLPFSDCAADVRPCLFNSVDKESDISDSVVMEKLQRSSPEEHLNRKGTARHRRARNASPVLSDDDDKSQEWLECSDSCLSDRDLGWEDSDSTSSLSSSSTSLSSSELNLAWGAGVRRPRGRDGYRRHRRSAHSPASPSGKGTKPGVRAFAANRQHRRKREKLWGTGCPFCSPSSPSSSSDNSGTAKGPSKSRARSRVAHTTKSRSDSCTLPPIVHAVVPAQPPQVLSPLMEEVLPSTRYATSAETPLAQGRQTTQATVANHSCASPSVAPPCTQQSTTTKGVEESRGTAEPTPPACEKTPTSPLQATQLGDLVTPPVTSSQSRDTNKGVMSLQKQSQKTTEPIASPATEPLNLDSLTELVLRLIQDLLARKGSAPEKDATTVCRKCEAAERERVRQEEVREAAKRTAEQSRLRSLILEAQQEARQAREEQVSLNSLTDSLQFALAQITRLSEHGDGAGDDTLQLGLAKRAAEEEGDPSAVIEMLNSNTRVHGSAGSDTMRPLGGGASRASGRNDGGMAVAAEGGRASSFPDSLVNAATLQRLITELRQRRRTREAELHLQRQRAKEADEKRRREEANIKMLREATKNKHTQELNKLVANEHESRIRLYRAEEDALDAMLVSAATDQEEAISLMRTAQRRACMLLYHEEFNNRATIMDAEEKRAAIFRDFSADLWQAANEARATRLQAEAEGMEEVESKQSYKGRSRSGQRSSSVSQSTTGTENIMISNVIPGQLLSIKGGRPLESGGKIRLLGDPCIDAVEAHARERRRCDRLRQQRLLSALPSRPGTNKANDGSGSRVSSRPPSTVCMGSFSSAAGARKTPSRASSRHFPALLPGGLSNENARGGGLPMRHLPSQSRFVPAGNDDLQIQGHKAGILPRVSRRASLPASARSTPLKGTAEIAVRLYNKQGGEELLFANNIYASKVER
ncbi:hypothetical protein, unknown function [Leishmania tarentolae]|uniref:Uncharacterized protein n=1 Tax=Leishmania tarentolae TaxID=5689 RepID=A0A640KAK3_LEITA|nr:hypothetical protein, unknown function [Leishmania tarentolae]